MVKNYHDAEDLTFEAFIKCFRALDSFDRSRRFSTWLFTIAHNTTLDFFRKNRIEYEYIDERHAVKGDISQEYEKKRKMEQIDNAIARLPPMDRELVLLFHKEEYSYREISDIVPLPITTITLQIMVTKFSGKDIANNIFKRVPVFRFWEDKMRTHK